MTSEHDEQVGFVQWFRDRFPGVLIIAIPNGGRRDMATAKRLKAEGVVAGVPDLFVPEWLLWIEMKRAKGGRVSADQRALAARLEGMGHRVIIGHGANDASRKVIEFRVGGAGSL